MNIIFKNNKYTKWYTSVINFRLQNPCSNDYVEKHHIVPKSLGGSNDKNNLVILSVREHIFCHKLLPKMVMDKKHKEKMMYCLYRIYHGNKEQRKYSSKFTARLVEQIKINHREAVRKRMTGHIKSDETRRKLSEANKGRKLTEEHKRNLSKSKKGISVIKPSDFGLKISKALKGKKKTKEHADKINKNPEKIRKTAEKHRGMKRTQQAKQNMSTARKKFIKENNGPPNKGMKIYYNPNNITEKIQCYPNNKPNGWVQGNPKMKGTVPYKNIETGEIKRYPRGTNIDGWQIWNPNKHY